MARIVWGLMGDSRGHLTRALIMAGELSRHELLFVGGGCAKELQALGHRVLPLPMPETILKDNRVDAWATAANFARLMLGKGAVLRALARELEAFRPDVAVSDYEFYLPRVARMLGVPCASFGHQHVLTRCRASLPPNDMAGRLATSASIRLFFSVPERFLVTSFFPAEPMGPDTTLLPPLLREDVRRIAPCGGEHVLVYMRAGVPSQLLAALAATGREVRAYCSGRDEASGPVRFLPFSRGGFLEDLASCAFVVTGGGHNLLSEALCLGKPVLALPAAMFYEQHVNAWQLRRLGWGDFFTRAQDAASAVADFEARLKERRLALASPPVCGNDQARRAVEALLP